MSDGDEVITLPVPEVLTAAYLVTMARPPDDLMTQVKQVARSRWPGDIGAMIRAMLAQDTPIVLHAVADQPPPPLELLAAMGANDDQLGRVGAATHVAVVIAHAYPGTDLLHESAARALAILVAESTDGELIDVLTYQILTVERAAATLPGDLGEIRLADWVWIDYSPDRQGYWCTTTGLRRFGLPELQTLTTPPNVVEQWGSAMTAIAGRLVQAWHDALGDDPGAAFLQLPARVTISAADVALAYRNDPPAANPTAGVRLTLDPRADPDHHSFLTTHPPLHWSGSAGEHIADVCATLFGARTSDVRHAPPSEAMDSAIATARSGLTDIRGRFESGQLDLHTKLLVKYALPSDVGTEYVWAYVTSWRDPYRILATSAADAIYHPKVRAGRPVVVDTAAVVDWAVEHDELGIVEGAWTQAALDET